MKIKCQAIYSRFDHPSKILNPIINTRETRDIIKNVINKLSSGEIFISQVTSGFCLSSKPETDYNPNLLTTSDISIVCDSDHNLFFCSTKSPLFSLRADIRDQLGVSEEDIEELIGTQVLFINRRMKLRSGTVTGSTNEFIIMTRKGTEFLVPKRFIVTRLEKNFDIS